MKKLFVSAFAMLAVALGFTACSSEDEFVNETPAQGQKVTVIATTEEPAQRTAFGTQGTDGTYPVLWSADDEITIGGNVFTLQSGDGTSIGEFEGTAPGSGTHNAYYPSTYNGTNWPTEQTYVNGNIPQCTPMNAEVVVEDDVISPISFKNEGGILRLNLKGTAKVKSIKISATGLDAITLNCGEAVQLDETTATPFHIAVPSADAPGTAYSGLKIEITDNTGAVCTKTLKSDKTITVQRSMITDINLTAKFPPAGSIGEATRTGDISVKWVQLWEGGPKFAEYNVGATSVAEYGDYLTWAENIASTQWGSNWRMPTKEELDALLNNENCTCTWTENYNGSGVNGLLCTGTGDYSTNSIFLPAAGSPDDDEYEGSGIYWSSTPFAEIEAHHLAFYSGGKGMYRDNRTYHFSVRAVLDETPKTKGTAEVNESAGIAGNKVNWVQLWAGGPKFAEYNVGATSVTEYGAYYTWGGTYANGEGIDWNGTYNEGKEILAGTDDTATALWGGNWRMPTKEELDALLNNENCTCTWTENYNGSGVNGLLCQGKEGTAFESNSVFLPAAGCYDKNFGGVFLNGAAVSCWSSTPINDGPGLSAYYLFFYMDMLSVDNTDKGICVSVRAVLNEAK